MVYLSTCGCCGWSVGSLWVVGWSIVRRRTWMDLEIPQFPKFPLPSLLFIVLSCWFRPGSPSLPFFLPRNWAPRCSSFRFLIRSPRIRSYPLLSPLSFIVSWLLPHFSPSPIPIPSKEALKPSPPSHKIILLGLTWRRKSGRI